jgi:hypothetical protein
MRSDKIMPVTTPRITRAQDEAALPPAREDRPRFSLMQRLVLALVPRIAWALIRIMGCTWRFEVIAEEGVEPVIEGLTAGPEVYCFWHQCVLPCTIYFRRSHGTIIVSRSFDGELVARVLELFGYHTVRGSSSSHAREGLLGLKSVIESGRPAIFTADGPRGPIYRTKMGPVKLAQLTGAPISAFHVEPERAWVLRSWDHFFIPKPFTKICVSWGPWTRVPADLKPENFEPKREELNAAIERARVRALAYFRKSAR